MVTQESSDVKSVGQGSQKTANFLPPRFLMVRAGLLNGWFITLLAFTIAAWSNGFSLKASNGFVDDVAAGIVAFGGLCYGCISTHKKFKCFEQDIKTITNAFETYVDGRNCHVYLEDKTHSPRLDRILIRDISERNPQIFDKMMKDPNDITDSKTLSHIIAGYIRTRPDIDTVSEILKTFKPYDSNEKGVEIDPRVYAMVKRCVDPRTRYHRALHRAVGLLFADVR